MLYDPKWEIPAEAKPAPEPWRCDLLRAAQIIEARGLKKYGFGGSPEDARPVCVLRALEIANYERRGVPFAGDSRDYFMRHVGTDSVINWTDNADRTQEEVIEALRGAALLSTEESHS